MEYNPLQRCKKTTMSYALRTFFYYQEDTGSVQVQANTTTAQLQIVECQML